MGNFIAATLLLASLSGAGQNSWLRLADYRLGGSGGPQFKITNIDGEAAVLGGGLLAVSTNPGFSWILTANYLEADAGGLQFGYGGIGMETSFRYRKLIQPMSQFQFGYGLAQRGGASTQAFVFEGTGMIGLRVGLGEKLILGGGYREVEGIHGVPGLTDSKLDGWYGLARLNYGIFDAAPEAMRKEGRRNLAFSGFYSGKWTRLNGQGAWLDGGGTTIIVGKRWAAGVSGYRSRNDLDYRGQAFSLAYGGLIGRWIFRPEETLHVSVACLAGAGGVGYEDKITGKTRAGAVPILDPDVFAEANLTEFLRLGVGLGYRIVPAGFEGLGPVDLSGPTASLQFATAAF